MHALKLKGKWYLSKQDWKHHWVKYKRIFLPLSMHSPPLTSLPTTGLITAFCRPSSDNVERVHDSAFSQSLPSPRAVDFSSLLQEGFSITATCPGPVKSTHNLPPQRGRMLALSEEPTVRIFLYIPPFDMCFSYWSTLDHHHGVHQLRWSCLQQSLAYGALTKEFEYFHLKLLSLPQKNVPWYSEVTVTLWGNTHSLETIIFIWSYYKAGGPWTWTVKTIRYVH